MTLSVELPQFRLDAVTRTHMGLSGNQLLMLGASVRLHVLNCSILAAGLLQLTVETKT